MKRLEGYFRHDVMRLLDIESGGVGVELGVAAGGFSRRMVDSGRFAQVFGVDMYGDGRHDIEQYKEALRTVGLLRPYKLLRMSFDEAYDLFEDGSLDFIYIDGYAHSGQEGGDTIYKWARKVRTGGVIAGDDYHTDFPLVIKAVNRFAQDAGYELCVTTETEPGTRYATYPSWAVVKTHAFDGAAPAEMVAEGKAEAGRIARKRGLEDRAVALVRRLVGEDRYAELRQRNREKKMRRKAK